jgi:F0F1-type ATP synthase membrane subunit c/vacuolar-type H+-ATPase subunit K
VAAAALGQGASAAAAARAAGFSGARQLRVASRRPHARDPSPC